MRCLVYSLFFIWLIVGLLAFFIELASVSLFFFLSFAVGAFLTSIVALFVESWAYQMLIFLGNSVASFIFLKYMFNPHKQGGVVTNVDRLPGMKCVVTKAIIPHVPGQVKLEGQIWAARSLGTEMIFEDDLVEVVRVQGCHVLVKKFNSKGVQS